MKNFKIHLKEHFPKLEINGCDAYFEAFFPIDLNLSGQRIKRPCIVICPGGGYDHISEREAEVVGNHFLPMGYNIFVLKYSVAPMGYFPQQLCELAGLIKLIHENSEEWNCDTNKIILMGFSAGGHLSAHYVNSFDCSEIVSIVGETYPVKANVLCYPVITANKFSHKDSFIHLVGHSLDELEIDKFSCEKMVSDKTPPTFIWHTADDKAVPVENSLLYATELSKHNIPFELHIFPFGTHGLSTADTISNLEIPKEVERVHEWLFKVKFWLNQFINN